MTPSILVVGATGNTGKSVVETLPKLLQSSKTLKDHRVIALARSAKSPVAQQFTKLTGVEVVEKNWIDIDAKWLRENEVTRAFIASHKIAYPFHPRIEFPLCSLGRRSRICRTYIHNSY